MEIIEISVVEAKKQNERATKRVVSCVLEDCRNVCPHARRGACEAAHMYFWIDPCPYARLNTEETSTCRAKVYKEQVKAFLDERDKFYRSHPRATTAHHQLVTIGEYVRIPYSCACMCKTVPFMRHSMAFVSGKSWLKVEDFTPDNIIKLFRFRPMALMGGEIKEYQANMPRFVYDLKHGYPELYEEVVKRCPEMAECLPDVGQYANVQISVHDLPVGEVTVVDKDRQAVGAWDGQKITMKGIDSAMMTYLTWGRTISDVTIDITFKPGPNFTVLPPAEAVQSLYEAGVYKDITPERK